MVVALLQIWSSAGKPLRLFYFQDLHGIFEISRHYIFALEIFRIEINTKSVYVILSSN